MATMLCAPGVSTLIPTEKLGPATVASRGPPAASRRISTFPSANWLPVTVAEPRGPDEVTLIKAWGEHAQASAATAHPSAMNATDTTNTRRGKVRTRSAGEAFKRKPP